MARHNEIGKEGEAIARRYLEKRGYRIAETNWRFRRAEVDLIAYTPQDVLVFLEVKTRSSEDFGSPASFVDDKKRRFMVAAARAYMIAREYEWEVRFDIIGVVMREPPVVRHYQDVFFR